MKWFTYSNATIICHHCEKEDLGAAKEMDDEQLNYATHKKDGLLNKKVINELGSCDSRVTDVYKGQVAQEGVHGELQLFTGLYSDNDKQVSKYDSGIDDWE